MPGAADYLARFEALHPRIIDLSLGRVFRLLARLGNPHEALPPVLHVAGTNGKGSTVAFLRAIAEAAGHRVHVFTSPHLVHFNERIVLGAAGGGAAIEDAPLAELLACVDAANGDEPITFFEITTAAALLAFSQTSADLVILETGLGGRLDATNVVAQPAATVITPVSIDHVGFLGDTIEAIAAEKAGIMKPGVPVIVGRQTDAAGAALAAHARRVAAPRFACGEDWDVFTQHGRLVYQDERGLLDLPLPRLAGAHQIDNAGAAIATARCALPAVSDDVMAMAMARVSWPARLERLEPGAFSEIAPHAELWLDGGHNPGAAEVLARALADLADRAPKPLHLILGMLGTKDAGGFLRPFAGLVRMVHTVPIIGSTNAIDAGELANIALAQGLSAEPADSIEMALARIAGEGGAARVLITGSLYLAGRAILAHRGSLVRL